MLHLKRRAFALITSLLLAAALTPARATEPAQDGGLAYAIGVQTYISGFPLMDLYRMLTSEELDQ